MGRCMVDGLHGHWIFTSAGNDTLLFISKVSLEVSQNHCNFIGTVHIIVLCM